MTTLLKILAVAIVFLSCNCSWISCHPGLGVAEVVDLDELEDDPFLDNPRYKYSFNVADDEEQTYQRQVQQMEDRVVTGEFSWVDALGTRHVTVYRADENGYRVLEMRREVGFVEISPTNLQPKNKAPPVRENKIAIANSRGAKLLERSRSFQNQPVQNVHKPSEILNKPNATKLEGSTESIISQIEEELIKPSTKSPISEVQVQTAAPASHVENNVDPSPSTKLEFQNDSLKGFGLGGKKVVRVIKRHRNSTAPSTPVKSNRLRKPVLRIPADKFDRSSSTTTTTTTTTTTEPIEDSYYDEDSDSEEVETELLPTFASFSQISLEKPEPLIFQATAAPRFVPQPVRIVPIPIQSNSLGPVERLPILLNTQTRESSGRSLAYGER